MTVKWVADTIAKSSHVQSDEALFAQFEKNVELAKQSGFRVDGVKLAKACLNERSFQRVLELVFNEESLSYFKNKVKITRIEFITEGPLPPELLEEPPFKNVAIYRQVVGYELCKSCRLCIEVCPKNVYRDDGTGRPDSELRRDAECTGPAQCGKCVDICPEKTISLIVADPSFDSSLYVLLDNPFSGMLAEENGSRELYIENPLEVGKTFMLSSKPDPDDLQGALRILNDSNFYPVLDVCGNQKHLVDSDKPERDIELWCSENYRDPEFALQAVREFLKNLPALTGLVEGKYDFRQLIERIVDEIIYANGELNAESKLERLKVILSESFMNEPFFGAKRRAIGGILPLGTSIAWKTPYGDEIPHYSHPEKCLGPECALCFTNCPEGGGGERSAIRMIPLVPPGAIPSLVRGLSTHLIRLDGAHEKAQDAENLTGKTPFEFVVHAEYCKACGVCIAYCPHEVIEPAPRIFDLRSQ